MRGIAPCDDWGREREDVEETEFEREWGRKSRGICMLTAVMACWERIVDGRASRERESKDKQRLGCGEKELNEGCCGQLYTTANNPRRRGGS